MYAIMELNIIYHFMIKAITQNVMIFNFFFVVIKLSCSGNCFHL